MPLVPVITPVSSPTITVSSPTISISSPIIRSPVYSPIIAPLTVDQKRAYLTNLLYTRSIPLVQSENLNYNDDARKRTIKYFYYKSLEKWFYEDMSMNKILCFVGDNRIVKSMDEYKKNKSKEFDESDKRKKIRFLSKNIFTKKLVEHLLNKFSEKYNIQWIHMHRHQYKVREFFAKQLYKKMVKEIRS